MKATQNIKIVKTGQKMTHTFCSGNENVYVAINEKMQLGYLPNHTTPYTPIGGKKTLKLVLDILEFR